MNPVHNNAFYYYKLAVISGQQKKYDEVISYCLKALSLDPVNILIHYALATAYGNLNQYREAIKHYSKAIEIAPDNFLVPLAHGAMASHMLVSGDFKHGWKEFEWRTHLLKRHQQIKESHYNESDLKDKTIYVHAEQGFGDTLQFCRYLPLVRSIGSKVIFICQPELKGLMQNVEGFDILETARDEDDIVVRKDGVNVLLLSLPRIFKTELDSIPGNVPYIRVNDEVAEKWKDRFNNVNTLKIGIAWEPSAVSNTYYKRACPLKYFYELAKIPGITLFSLQKSAVEKIANLPVNNNIVDLTNEINDFSDTAAIINNLDLIISIDTSVVHLAGAMGKPVWVLLPFNADWRWLLEKDDNPWYPTMRLFRKPREDDWQSVFNKVEPEIMKMIPDKL